MKTVAARITGRVQGVGFRAFVLSEARARGIKGEVWNTRDDSVEAIFQGSEQQLQAMAEALWDGPGRVENVQLSELQSARAYDSFQVSATR